ncbi:uncharacterized protein KY384_003722 [Bacidia gigantensis]|uniref:uncharacterized protein n=1 Tax=Bacidia gigantensis TaxID=2732470 RepID=UPI001D03F8B9|nr:uncharacterized protein KY384_003722 [Bacidia gigantensis]KAG8532085.1 hypothetical protein KY384_003722 [Bacidia gigantensis]
MCLPNRMLTFDLALILGFAYTFAQDNKFKKVSFFVIKFQAIWLPWAILGLTLVLGGPNAAMRQVTGLVAAHLYDFLTRIWPVYGGGKNYVVTPTFVKRWFGADKRGSTVKAYGTAIRPQSHTAKLYDDNMYNDSTMDSALLQNDIEVLLVLLVLD